MLEQTAHLRSAIWIERWSNANSAEPNQQLGLYLGVYAALCFVAILGMAGELW